MNSSDLTYYFNILNDKLSYSKIVDHKVLPNPAVIAIFLNYISIPDIQFILVLNFVNKDVIILHEDDLASLIESSVDSDSIFEKISLEIKDDIHSIHSFLFT